MRIVITYLICSIKELDLVLRVCFTLFKVNYNVQLIPVSYSLYWYSREHLQNILESCTAICKCNWCEFYSPRPQLLKNRQCNAWSVIFLWYPKTSDAATISLWMGGQGHPTPSLPNTPPNSLFPYTHIHKNRPWFIACPHARCTVSLSGTLFFVRACPAGTLSCLLNFEIRKLFSTVVNFHLIARKIINYQLVNLLIHSFIPSLIHSLI